MKRKINFQGFLSAVILILTATAITFSACKKRMRILLLLLIQLQGFQFEVSQTNYMEVTFTNFSQNATSYTWDFGDGETSTEKETVLLLTQQ